jgi:hypothetical protein
VFDAEGTGASQCDFDGFGHGLTPLYPFLLSQIRSP